MTRAQATCQTFSYLDRLVGEVSGSICTTLSAYPVLGQKRFVFLPAVTYKVKGCLRKAQEESRWTDQHLSEMAKRIRAAIIPVMWTFDVPSDLMPKLSPDIERSAFDALIRAM